MPPLLVPDVGESIMLQNILNKTAPENQSLRLYQNNITPAETDTAATYTVATWTGYANISLTGASWTVSGTAPTQAAAAQQTWTSTAGSQSQNNYGYYVVQASSGILMWAERFSDGPYLIVNNGDQIKVTPVITLD
jgi:hypothetical protein